MAIQMRFSPRPVNSNPSDSDISVSVDNSDQQLGDPQAPVDPSGPWFPLDPKYNLFPGQSKPATNGYSWKEIIGLAFFLFVIGFIIYGVVQLIRAK